MNANSSIEPRAPKENGANGENHSLQEALASVADSRGRVTFDEFVALLGRELRDPLAPLRNAIHILERAHLDAPAARTVEMIDRQVQTLTRLVDDLLDISHIADKIVPSAPAVCRMQLKDPRRPALAALRILIVDDNEDAAQSLAELLQLHGYEVRAASTASAALEASEKYPFDVVVLDIGLPDRDGYQLARDLRANPEGGRYLLIAVTGYGQEEDRRRSWEAGIDHHLTKPIEITRLLGLLAERSENEEVRAPTEDG